jgi:anti-anti-sigma factor
MEMNARVAAADAATGMRKKPSRRTRSWPCPNRACFAIVVVHAYKDVLLQLSGTLDVSSRDAFDDCVAAAVEEQPRRLVFDLAAVDAIDLVGAGCFARAARRAEAAGVHVVLESPSKPVLKLLDNAGVAGSFSIR